MSPFLALATTGLAILGIMSFHDLSSLWTYNVILLTLLSWRVQTILLIWKSIKWTLPFAIPLILIHGLLNPSFPKSLTLWEIISIRGDGILYGLLISSRIWLITIVGTSWSYINRDELIDQLIQWRLPLSLIVVCAQAISTMDFIERRARSVYIAQQARGIATGPGILSKLRALQVMVIPVVLSTLVDAHARSQCLENRGLGIGKILISRIHLTPRTDLLLAGIGLSSFIIIIAGFRS